ncbi:hypothetical protein [Stieleria varia]|uniref:Uncharacterized protein n=1 Tax=Stieleria varia TaxID=2528005 RepID=A0A5C5ZX01_9BACT|nr:hypothetical protein [Stieleria varia]TWT91507.1 hypothetical protein Pla52n_65980 [Stieleria varia]
MNKHDSPAENTEELLDRITSELRNQAIPPMPAHLTQRVREFHHIVRPNASMWAKHSRKFALLAVAATLVVAVTAAWSLLTRQRSAPGDRVAIESTNAPPRNDAVSAIATLDVMQVLSFTELSDELDQFDLEIQQLKREAQQLDARHEQKSILQLIAKLEDHLTLASVGN